MLTTLSKRLASAAIQLVSGKSPGRPRRSRPHLELLEDRDLLTAVLHPGFAGIHYDSSGITPPDPIMAVGPSSIVSAVNVRLQITSKTGSSIAPTEPFSTFFASIANPSSNFSDPYIVYDDIAQRFYISILELESGGNNIDLAVSTSNNPADLSGANWYFHQINMVTLEPASPFTDFDKLGYNADAVFISTNQFSSTAFVNNSITSIAKSSILSGGAPSGYIAEIPNSSPSDFLMPARMHGATTGGPEYFVQVGAAANTITVVTETGVLNPNPSFTGTQISVAAYQSPVNGVPGFVAANEIDDRILSADWLGNNLVAAQTIGDAAANAHARWYEFSTAGSSPTLAQQGTIGSGAGPYQSYPAVAIDSDGDIAIVYDENNPSTNENVSVYFAAHEPGEASGTVETPLLVQAGAGTLNSGGRGGDYSAIEFDDAMTTGFPKVWFDSEYAFDNTTNQGNWGTFIGQAQFPLPGSATPLGFSPAQIRHAYQFDQINLSGTVGDGTGQTIAIVVAYHDPNIQSDLSAFDSAFGIPDPAQLSFSVFNENGGTTLPTAFDPNAPSQNSWEAVEALSVEWVHALAPKANIDVVEANTSQSSDMFLAAQTAAGLPGVSVVLADLRYTESSNEVHSDSDFVHQYVTFVAPAGDVGPSGGTIYPSTSPNVLAVGGTSLQLNADNTWKSESYWNDGGVKGGGGTSTVEAKPAYQNYLNTGSTTKRTTTDVAFDAAPMATGIPFYDSFDFQSTSSGGAGFWAKSFAYGGTEFAAAAWASILAIANQGRQLEGVLPLTGATDTLPMLYGMPSSAFHVIASNGVYDTQTGRGSPIANLVVANLIPTKPGAAVTSVTVNGNILQFAVTGNGLLYENTFNPAANTSSGWTVTNSSVTFAAGATVTPYTQNGNIYVYGVATDNHVHEVSELSGSTSWSNNILTSAATFANGTPLAQVAVGGTVYLYGVATDGFTRELNGTPGSGGWVQQTIASSTGFPGNTPFTAELINSTVYLYGAGNDQLVREISGTPGSGTWKVQTIISDTTFPSDTPFAAQLQNGTIYLYGVATDQIVRQIYGTPGSSTWSRNVVASGTQFATDSPFALWDNGGNIHLYGIAGDGYLRELQGVAGSSTWTVDRTDSTTQFVRGTTINIDFYNPQSGPYSVFLFGFAADGHLREEQFTFGQSWITWFTVDFNQSSLFWIH